MNVYDRYAGLRARLSRFRLSRDPEILRTLGILDALIDRAANLGDGASPAGKFPTPALYPAPGGMFDWAEDYLRALESGVKPFLGTFSEPGMSISDHSFVQKDGRLHVFYNRVFAGYPWWERSVDTIGHAVTDDLIHWEALPIAVATSPDRFDSRQAWSPAVVEKDGKYYLFYTGCNEHVAQAPCLAVSDDLMEWRTVASPLFTPGPWCPWDAGKWSNARDSMVFPARDGAYYMYYCTSAITPEGEKDGMGMASSRDLLTWRDEGYTLDLNTERASESPFVVCRDGRYFLFFTDCARGGTGWAESDGPLGPWKIRPGDEHMVLGGNVCASEALCFKGKWYLSYVRWIRPELLSVLGFVELFWEKDGFRLGRDLTEIAGKEASL